MKEADNHVIMSIARKPLFLLLTCGATLLCGAYSFSYSLLYLCTLALATAFQAVLFRAGRWLHCLLFTLCALALSYLVTHAIWAMFLIATCTIGAYVLAHLGQKGKSRGYIAVALLTIYAIALLLALAMPLVMHMIAEGRGDLFAYLDTMMDEKIRDFSNALARDYMRVAEIYKEMKIELAIPTGEEIRETLLFGTSLLPAFFLCFCAIPAISATYWLQLVGYCIGDNGSLVSAENRTYRPSAILGVSYLIMMPVGFLWGDFRDIVCLVCMNFAVFVTPVLAFGAILQVRRLIAFMRRMSIGNLDFIFFLILLVLFVLANLLYVLLFLAVAYAIYLLKCTFFSRKKSRE